VELIFANILGNWTTGDGGLGYVLFFFMYIPSVGFIAIGGKHKHSGAGIILASGYLGFVTSIVFDNFFTFIPFIGVIGLSLMAAKGGFLKL